MLKVEEKPQLFFNIGSNWVGPLRSQKCAFLEIFGVLADISATVTPRQKLKKADPNYFSIWGTATKNCMNIVKNEHFEFGEDPPRHKIEKNWGPKTSTFHVD